LPRPRALKSEIAKINPSKVITINSEEKDLKTMSRLKGDRSLGRLGFGPGHMRQPISWAYCRMRARTGIMLARFGHALHLDPQQVERSESLRRSCRLPVGIKTAITAFVDHHRWTANSCKWCNAGSKWCNRVRSITPLIHPFQHFAPFGAAAFAYGSNLFFAPQAEQHVANHITANRGAGGLHVDQAEFAEEAAWKDFGNDLAPISSGCPLCRLTSSGRGAVAAPGWA
jgi:hypothetical protein